MPTVSMTCQDMDTVSLRFFKGRLGCLGSREFENRINTLFFCRILELSSSIIAQP